MEECHVAALVGKENARVARAKKWENIPHASRCVSTAVGGAGPVEYRHVEREGRREFAQFVRINGRRFARIPRHGEANPYLLS
ncbi:hypothetical protein Scep_008488 [Stephania cephalantha]|uniref:Uncharacterized protein n=1 Tax=Stephania cephalantha TaxID=152367 RepID=A0AAP0KBT3_9MAGN